MGLIFKNLFLAIPFYFLWNGLAPTYFATWPEAFHQIPFLHCVAFMLLLAILRMAVMPFEGPKFVSSFSWGGGSPGNGGAAGGGAAGRGARRSGFGFQRGGNSRDQVVDVN